MAVAVALGSVALGIAQLAVDLAVRGVARDHGVQRAVALAAVVAGLVPLLKREREGEGKLGPVILKGLLAVFHCNSRWTRSGEEV